MKLIEADKVKQAIKDYWKAQVDRAPIPKSTEEYNAYVNCLDAILERNDGLLKAIDELPPAEPDTTTHDSIPVKKGGNDGDKTSGDCVSRQAAIDTLRKMQTYKLFAGDDMLLIDQAEAQTELMMLPSAKPVHKTGRWIEMSSTNHTYKCSVCGRLLVNITDGKNNVAKNYPYCHCGADMRPTERNSNV